MIIDLSRQACHIIDVRQTILKLSRAIFSWPPLSATNLEKQLLIARHGRQRGINNFIETGTFQGEMIEAQRENFKKLVSIELGDELYQAACRRFEKFGHIQLLHGDSGMKLSEAIRLVDGPTLYWLDAHYSRGATARGEKETPVLKELSIIAARREAGDLILIDDARHFGLKMGYPRISTVRKFVARTWPNYSFIVEADVICIIPP
jgi:hypothetical protein